MKIINSGWTIIIVFVLFGLVALSFGYFHEYAPIVKQAQFDEDYATSLQTEGNKLDATKKNVKKAIQIVKDSTAAWNTYKETHTPATSVRAGGIDIAENPYDLFRDTYTFRDNMQRIVNAQLEKGGVKIVNSGPELERPTDPSNVGGLLASYYHFPGYPFPVVIYNLGTVQVRGTYDQIIANVRAWKSIPHLLAVTDGLRIDGTSPHLTGTYQLTVVGFIRGTKT
ncbi:MAG TPA: hypothetical protein VG944_12600, partial [Fimbriimonas sp.]|nr:hypothetical protein [Fimbriimonas sp.]